MAFARAVASAWNALPTFLLSLPLPSWSLFIFWILAQALFPAGSHGWPLSWVRSFVCHCLCRMVPVKELAWLVIVHLSLTLLTASSLAGPQASQEWDLMPGALPSIPSTGQGPDSLVNAGLFTDAVLAFAPR